MFFWGLLVSLVGSLPGHFREKSEWQRESGIQAIKVLCAAHQNTTGLGSFTNGAKNVQARYEMEGQFLPRNNMVN